MTESKYLLILAIFLLVTHTTPLKYPRCLIKDTEHFRDIYIDPNSDLGSKIYIYDIGSSTLVVSLCTPIPEKLLTFYNCPTDKKVNYVRIETTVTSEVVRVCANRINFSSIINFTFEPHAHVYFFLFIDRPEDETLQIQFPYPTQQTDTVFERVDQNKMNILKLKGDKASMTVQNGFAVSDN